MATLNQLENAGSLKLIKVKPDRRTESAIRRMFATPEFYKWLMDDVRKATALSRLDISPGLQALDLLKQFIGGKPFDDPRLFKRMMPMSDDIWEFSTPDLRFFGWFAERDCYIAVAGDFVENLKNDKKLYEVHRIASMDHRKTLDLDEPKYLKDGKYRDVISD
jgi:hypothetical protein